MDDSKKAFIIVTLFSSGLFLVTILRILDHSSWVTGGQHLTWIDGQTGEVIPYKWEDESSDWTGCISSDQQVQTDDGIWIECDHFKSHRDGIMAFLDPKSKTATLWEPHPQLSYLSIHGMDLNENGDLAITYLTHAGEYEYAMGILSKAGWVLEPRTLPLREWSYLKSTVWINDRVHIFFQESPTAPDYSTSLIVIRVDRQGNVSPRQLPNHDELCTDPFRCDSYPCRVFFKDNQWQATYKRWLREAPDGAHDYLHLQQDGEIIITDTKGICPLPYSYMYSDYHSPNLGLVEDGLSYYLFDGEHNYRQRSDGEFEKIQTQKSSWKVWGNWFIDVTPGLQHQLKWYLPQEDYPQVAFPYKNQWLYMDRSVSAYTISSAFIEKHQSKIPPTKPIVRGSDCDGLTNGTLLPKDNGGLWLVSHNGCFIELDENLERLDPLSIYEHLVMGGSWNRSWNDVENVYMVLFLLLGFPLFLFVPWLINKLRQSQTYLVANWLLLTYSISGSYLISQVYPLLF